MRTYTTREAAQLTGSTVRALRKRIERGQLRAVRRGRYWHISHDELERIGLLEPSRGAEGTEPGGTRDLPELDRLRAENTRLRQEVAGLRPLTAWIETATSDLVRERAARKAAEARAEAAADAVADLRERQRRLATAGPLERRRLLSELRLEGAMSDSGASRRERPGQDSNLGPTP